jgi:hypothetical protein
MDRTMSRLYIDTKECSTLDLSKEVIIDMWLTK